MKHKNAFVIPVVIFFCFGLLIGLSHTGVYGKGDHDDLGNHGNHNNNHDGMYENMGKTGIKGVVSSISGSTISVLGIAIDASDAEVTLRDCMESLGVDDIVVGDTIEVKGKLDDGSFVANMIKLEGTGKLEGTVEAVGTNTVTLLGKEVDISSASCKKGKIAVGKKTRVYVRNSDAGLTALVVKATGMGMMEVEYQIWEE